jgi:hypothetical protein
MAIMKRTLNWVKQSWTDQVWSKVFAAGIIGLISTVSIFLWSIIKNIPFGGIIKSLITFLNSRSFTISYLTITVIIIVLLIIVIPMLRLRIISIQLKHLRVPPNLREKAVDIFNLLNGDWKCEYKRDPDEIPGREIAKITNGNHYIINGKLYFVLTGIKRDLSKNQISWTKTTYPHNTKHSRETLKIVSAGELSGSDDQGYSIKYMKI